MQLVEFGSICELQNGRAFKPEEWSEVGTPIIRIQNLNDETKSFNYCEFDVESRFHVSSGDLLFSWSGTPGTSFGAFFWNRGKGFLNQHIFRVDIDNRKVDKFYLRYAINSKLNLIIEQAHGGVGLKHITKGKLEAIQIPLPPLEEQKRIAAILDKADAIRRKRQQAIKLADDFLRSVFLEMFGDPVTNPKGFQVHRLGDFCEDLFLGLTSKVDYIDDVDGFPLIRAKDINTGELRFDDVKYISESQHRKLTKNHLTKKGDLLVSKSGTLGTCAIVRTDREFSTYESIFTVRPITSKLNIFYLIHLLQNKGFKDKLIGNKVGGTVAHLNLKMFRDFEVGVPPIVEQEAFSTKIIKIESKMEKYKKSYLLADDFFESLSQKAFSGSL